MLSCSLLIIMQINDKICRFLSTKDLMTCRRLNRFWHSSTVRILKERGAENCPMVIITNGKSKGKDISAHLKFLRDRKYTSIEWIRTYKFDVFMDGPQNTNEQSTPNVMGNCAKLISLYGQQVVSMDLKYQDMSDVLLTEVSNNPHFSTLFTGLKEIRFAVARLHHSSLEDPQCLVNMLNSMPNLTRLTLCYTRMFQQFMADEPCDYFCMTLSELNRLSKLEHLTISLNYISFCFIKDLNIMQSLKFLKIFVQGEADLNLALFEFLRKKCPSLKELYLIRLGALASWSHAHEDFPDNEPDWLTRTRQLEIEFPRIQIVVEKRF